MILVSMDILQGEIKGGRELTLSSYLLGAVGQQGAFPTENMPNTARLTCLEGTRLWAFPSIDAQSWTLRSTEEGLCCHLLCKL